MSGNDGLPAAGMLPGRWRTITLVAMALLGAVVLVALIVTLGEANKQRDRALRLQAHSYDVMILARTLSGTIARSEASLGRYVISGDRRLGQLYFDEWRLAGGQIDRLEIITSDNTEQRPMMQRLRTAFNSRGVELSLTALNTNYGKNAQALSRYYASLRAPALVEITRTLDAVIAQERQLLQMRTDDAMALVARSTTFARVLSVFGVLIVLGAIALGWLTLNAQAERAVAQADAEAERERAEALAAAVTEATDELRVQEARLRQVQKMEAIGQLTGGIAHDFNNMLAVVLGGLELAKRSLAVGSGAVAGTTARHIDSATEGANRAAALTRQLLAFAREGAINPEPIDAGGLIGGMRDLLDRTLGDAITVQVVDRSQGWRVRADRVQLENALLNLAVNARDAMNGRGALTIVAEALTLASGEQGACSPGQHLALAVVDTGCGMAPEVAERVFEPFFTTKPVGKGTGLGLSQIFGFARQLGGEVGIVSVPGEGTTVTLYLPRDTTAGISAAVPEPRSVETVSVETGAVETGAPRTLSILVVEDDPRVLAATVDALEELGHRPVACDDPLAAPAALDVAAKAGGAGFDLIISDVLMPGRTGPEMIAALDVRHAAIPVMFVTGFTGEASDAAEFAGRHVLRKPFTLVALERAVIEAAGAGAGAVPEQIAAE